MSGTVGILCRPATAAGFGLAGVTAEEIPTGIDPSLRIETVLSQGGTGVLLIEESLYDAVGAELRIRLERSTRPVAVPFPGPSWGAGAAAEERVVELLRKAIGYRVRLT